MSLHCLLLEYFKAFSQPLFCSMATIKGTLERVGVSFAKKTSIKIQILSTCVIVLAFLCAASLKEIGQNKCFQFINFKI